MQETTGELFLLGAAASGPASKPGSDLSPSDIFKGDVTDKLGDGGFADPRETKLISLANNVVRLNKVFGDPLGIGDDPFNRGGAKPAPPPNTEPAPAPAQTVNLGVKDP